MRRGFCYGVYAMAIGNWIAGLNPTGLTWRGVAAGAFVIACWIVVIVAERRAAAGDKGKELT